MLSDKEIIELFWARNPDAVKEVHRIYGRKLMGIAQRILAIPEDAKECVNDTYYKAWSTIPPTRPRNLYAYLSEICRNTALGMLDWKNAAKRKAEVVSLTTEMESCIPDSRQNFKLEEKELGRILSEYSATLSNFSSIRSRRLYLATQSLRLGAPLLIWPALTASARSVMVESSVSPERWEMMSK